MLDVIAIRLNAREQQQEAEENRDYSGARTAEEWATDYDCSPKTFRAMMHDGRVTAKPEPGGKYRVLLAELNKSNGWEWWNTATYWAKKLGYGCARTFKRHAAGSDWAQQHKKSGAWRVRVERLQPR